MNHRKDNNLDRLLRYWASREHPDKAHLESLRRRISQAADQLEGAGTEVGSIPDDDPTAGRRRKALLPATWSSRLADRAKDTPGEQWAGVPPEVRLDRQQ